MALVAEFICRTCEKPRHEVVHQSRICIECRTIESSRARRVHFAGLKGLTIEERLQRLEEQAYNLDTERRLRLLEVNNVRY